MRHEKPENYNNPDFIPSYEEWPNTYRHDDWPRGRGHMWNDTESSCVGRFDHECCNDDYPEDCVCVTSADAMRWNNYSAFNYLSGFNTSSFSALSAIDVDALSAVMSAVGENSDIWTSAIYVPNIYDNLDLIFSALNDKANRSEIGKGIYVHSDYFAGNGTENSVLRLSTEVRTLLAMIETSLSGYGPLITSDNMTTLKKDINTLRDSDVNLSASLETAWEMIRLLANGSPTPTPTPGSSNFKEIPAGTSIEDAIITSKANPDVFYYSAANTTI